MLNFFKKPGRRSKESPEYDVASPTEKPYDPSRCQSLGPFGPLAVFEDEGLDLTELETKDKSRLSKTLSDVLVDKSALGYFIQFMENRNSLHFIRCWLDIENFQTAIQQHEDTAKDMNNLSSFSTKIEHDSLSVSTDCDSYTADSTSICDFSDAKTDRSRVDLVNNCDIETASLKLNEREHQLGKIMQEFTDDALRIFKKYIALEAPEKVNCPDNIRNQIVENICSTDNKLISSNCFKDIQSFVFGILEKEYFEAFLSSDYFCKYQIDVLTSGNVVLEDILYNETALFYFMEFLEQESYRSLLEFWLAASNFHQQLHDQKDFFDPIEAQNDAVILYDKYFSLQAHCPLGFGDKIRFAVEQNICGENGLMHDCFHLPLKIIEQVLDKHYLKPFLASQLYYKYLSELINTVQSVGYCIYGRTKSISSECGSEKSFSTTSTFLALENPNKFKKRDKQTDMNIDTRQLYDPDSLWKRKKYHRLSFGRVTDMGKFVKDFEPEPDKRGESKLKNVVRKFVNLEEDKKKEELAWQVAEMIVKDITSITLNEQKT
ncbi:PREDICTED: A-kinase anchor protein 10, mitochondrial isoform X1 [Nicrophorus vespilloides]|uniref:A-kinase anchor protein 10, mitochondrial isoform X1 n=2 Tax=Nicrophorus vespilloides TaxID=110193 RepID=A0ABM1MMK2_NICVS|nr:PREDICTED: A-kinase anchor protein 10, mitochondrial isoform X1 [Nicrophorus vespilloides]